MVLEELIFNQTQNFIMGLHYRFPEKITCQVTNAIVLNTNKLEQCVWFACIFPSSFMFSRMSKGNVDIPKS